MKNEAVENKRDLPWDILIHKLADPFLQCWYKLFMNVKY